MLPKVTSGRSGGGHRGKPPPPVLPRCKKIKEDHSHDGSVTDINLTN